MKKFLAILLLATISCSVAILEDNDNVEGISDFFKRLWEKIVEFWEDIPQKVQEVIKILKEEGHWETLINLLKKYGTKYAIDFCDNYLDTDICTEAIKWIFDLLDIIK